MEGAGPFADEDMCAPAAGDAAPGEVHEGGPMDELAMPSFSYMPKAEIPDSELYVCQLPGCGQQCGSYARRS